MAGKRYVSTSISVDVDLSEFDDDAIVQEAVDRDLAGKVAAVAAGKSIDEAEEKSGIDTKAIAGSVMSYLVCKRPHKAAEQMRELLAAFVPPDIVDAADALREGRVADAIGCLDRFIEPSPAATATELPRRAA